MKNILIFITVMIISAGMGFTIHKLFSHNENQSASVTGTQRPEFAALDANGQIRNIKEWDGKLIFLNFWATWCPPCLREIPDFIDLQQTYGNQGIQFVGIAIDNSAAVQEYIDEVGMNYPTMVVELEGASLAKRYGNETGALPFTAVINRNGEISSTITGELSKNDAKTLLKKHGINL